MCVLQRSKSDACEEQIQDEVQRQVKKCVCPKQYHMHKLTDGQYRVCRLDYFYCLLFLLQLLLLLLLFVGIHTIHTGGAIA